jgi:hypothetical protein
MVLLVDGVLAEAASGPTGWTGLTHHQHGPSQLDRREAIGFFGNVEYDYRVFEGDRALVAVTGMPGFPFPSYQLPASSIRHSGTDSVTRARASTRGREIFIPVINGRRTECRATINVSVALKKVTYESTKFPIPAAAIALPR